MYGFWKLAFLFLGVSSCIKGCYGFFSGYQPGWWYKIIIGLAIIYLEIVFTTKKVK